LIGQIAEHGLSKSLFTGQCRISSYSVAGDRKDATRCAESRTNDYMYSVPVRGDNSMRGNCRLQRAPGPDMHQRRLKPYTSFRLSLFSD